MRTAASALATALFTLFVPAIIAVGIPQTWIRETGIELYAGSASRIIGGALIALGAIGYFWCAALFVKAQGTPAPVFPTQRTVVGGLYRINRNPMYTSVLAIVFGQATLYRYRALAIYGACLALGFHLFVIFYEEPTLRARFDGEYEEFCRRVPRWIPRLRS
jgi:protein-S-isoprenylcysteine O-methyltransferase Ste14